MLNVTFNIDSGRLGMLVGMKNAVQGGEARELGSSDDEGWQEKEASRTHSVKFTDEPTETDKEVSKLYVANPPSFFRFWFIRIFGHITCWKCSPSYDSLRENYIH